MTYAIKTTDGYIAMQGYRYWTQDTPNGWAEFTTAQYAEQVAASYGRQANLDPTDDWYEVVEVKGGAA